jgi:tetratricopeptide (TPR) repeat protein
MLLAAALGSCATKGAAQAEEYFSIGMAFFDLGRFQEAEQWLNRARSADRTMVASEYNLGRIAFETGRFEEAARLFERILVSDPENVMALQAAAFARIKNGDLQRAESHYSRVLALVPENADDGFNHALVLYALERYKESEEVLNRYPFALDERAPSVLLLARNHKAQEKVEAIDTYARWVIVNADDANPRGFFEYAEVLEAGGFYARALEQYEVAINTITKDSEDFTKSMVMFEKARLLLTVDPQNSEGIQVFNASITAGFADTAAIRALLDDQRLSNTSRAEVRKVLEDLLIKERAAQREAEESEEEDEEEEEE